MQCQRGFTLIELVVVLILTAILAVSALPRLTGPNDFAARASYDQVRSTLRYARQSAIAMRRNVCVQLGLTRLAVTHAAATGAGQACAAGNLVLSPDNSRPFDDDANALTSGAPLAAAGTLVFDAVGRPYSSVGNALTAPVSFSVTGYPHAVTVEPETGVVR